MLFSVSLDFFKNLAILLKLPLSGFSFWESYTLLFLILRLNTVSKGSFSSLDSFTRSCIFSKRYFYQLKVQYKNNTGVRKTVGFHYKMMNQTPPFTLPYFSDIIEKDKTDIRKRINHNCFTKQKRETLKPDYLCLNPGSAIYQLCDFEQVPFFLPQFPHL